MALEKKIGLVLAGGGVAGIEFEIGSLMALWDLGVRCTDFDFITGVSAGAILGSLIANGFTPHEINDGLHGRNEDLSISLPKVLGTPNYAGIGNRIKNVQPRLRKLAKRAFRHNVGRWFTKDRSSSESNIEMVADLIHNFSVPPLSSRGLEKYLANIFRSKIGGKQRTDTFDELSTNLVISAVDANTKYRVVMGPYRLADMVTMKDTYLTDVPISKAVAASASIPGLYAPTKIRGRHLMDGEVTHTANADLAVTMGRVDLLMVVNPLVPYVGNNVEQYGIIDQVQQALRIRIDGSLKRYLKFVKSQPATADPPYNKQHDVILIEPHNNPQLFHYFLLRKKETVVQAGYDRVMQDVAAKREYYKKLGDDYGINLRI